MNPELKKTLAFAGTAVVLLVLVLVTGGRRRTAEVFSDLGQPFYGDFTDPLKATALEVTEYNEATAQLKPFRVEFAGGRWVIPSHHAYPADAKDRLAKTASSVIGLKKDAVASEVEKDHEALGVIDPLDQKASGTKGRGRRVAFYAGDTKLADFVFGKEAGEGKRYVRVPGQKRTYVSQTPGEISAKFEDWVETDLLQVSQGAVRKVTIDKYSFDEDAVDIKNRTTNTLVREEAAKPWTLNELKAEEEVHSENVSALMSALDDLKIAGVRPKPPLIAKQKDLSNLKELGQQQLGALAAELGRRGFFVFTDRQRTSYSIVCNEGEMHVACDDGIVYHLRFGELLIGEGEAITAGGAAEVSGPEKKDDQKPTGTESRYLFVSVRFDESLLPAAPAAPAEYKADPAKKPEEQKVEEEKAKAAKEDYERKKKEHEQKVADGKKRAEKLADRFAPWYYVISGDAFKKLRLDRPALVKPKEKKDEAKPADGHEHKEGDGHKHDEKKPEPPKAPEAPKPEEPKSEAPKPAEPKKAEEPKAETPKPDEKKPEDAKKP